MTTVLSRPRPVGTGGAPLRRGLPGHHPYQCPLGPKPIIDSARPALLDDIQTAVERESIRCNFLECVYGPDRDDYGRLAAATASCRDLEGLAVTFDAEGRLAEVAAGPDPICDPPTGAQLECIRLAVADLWFPCLAGRSLCVNPWTCE